LKLGPRAAGLLAGTVAGRFRRLAADAARSTGHAQVLRDVPRLGYALGLRQNGWVPLVHAVSWALASSSRTCSAAALGHSSAEGYLPDGGGVAPAPGSLFANRALRPPLTRGASSPRRGGERSGEGRTGRRSRAGSLGALVTERSSGREIAEVRRDPLSNDVTGERPRGRITATNLPLGTARPPPGKLQALYDYKGLDPLPTKKNPATGAQGRSSSQQGLGNCCPDWIASTWVGAPDL